MCKHIALADAVPKLASTMGRFRDPPDPLFQRLNSSLEFDRRLAPHDIAGSRAHARALRSAGVLDDAELERLLEGLDAVERELEQGTFGFEPDDEDIHTAIERRLTELAGPVGESFTPAVPATTRSRRTPRFTFASAPGSRSSWCAR